ncbi:MAG: hypothetical protein LRZ84_14360 [Desertifilum sp.]|nr:hypothetical protein [Desertifilum sp.]
MIKASVALYRSGKWLVPAGRGHQPDADYNAGDVIGEEVTPSSDSWLEVKIGEKIYCIAHGHYTEILNEPSGLTNAQEDQLYAWLNKEEEDEILEFNPEIPEKWGFEGASVEQLIERNKA